MSCFLLSALTLLSYLIFITALLLFQFHKWRNWSTVFSKVCTTTHLINKRVMIKLRPSGSKTHTLGVYKTASTEVGMWNCQIQLCADFLSTRWFLQVQYSAIIFNQLKHEAPCPKAEADTFLFLVQTSFSPSPLSML